MMEFGLVNTFYFVLVWINFSVFVADCCFDGLVGCGAEWGFHPQPVYLLKSLSHLVYDC